MVHHNSESSLVVKVNSKQHLDKSLMELKESTLVKLHETLFLGGWCFEVPCVEEPDPCRSPWVPLLRSSRFDKNIT